MGWFGTDASRPMTEDQALAILREFGLSERGPILADCLDIIDAINAGVISGFEGRVRIVARALSIETGSLKPLSAGGFFELVVKVLPTIRRVIVIQNAGMMEADSKCGSTSDRNR